MTGRLSSNACGASRDRSGVCSAWSTEDRYCIDVLEQISAATRALQSVALQLLEGHMGHCVAEAVKNGGDEATDKLSEAVSGHRTAGPFVSPPR